MSITKLTYHLFLEYLLILKNFVNYNPLPQSWRNGTRGNVLLLPGVYENAHFFLQLGSELNTNGFRVHQIDSLVNQSMSVDQYCTTIKQFINNNQLNKVILLAHSKGGLIAKSLLIDPSINKKIFKTICIATPFGGSWLSKLIPGGRDLAPNSSLIKKLDSNKQYNHLIHNLYPIFDNHVIPNRHLFLQGAKNYQVDVIGHTRILENKETINLIKKILVDVSTV